MKYKGIKYTLSYNKFQFVQQKEWIAANFPKDKRFEYLILEAENVITAETFKYVSICEIESTSTCLIFFVFYIHSLPSLMKRFEHIRSIQMKHSMNCVYDILTSSAEDFKTVLNMESLVQS